MCCCILLNYQMASQYSLHCLSVTTVIFACTVAWKTSFRALTLLCIRKSMQPVKFEWWDASIVICLQQGANGCIWYCWCHYHPIIIKISVIKIQNRLNFPVPDYPGYLERSPLNVCLSCLKCMANRQNKVALCKQSDWRDYEIMSQNVCH